MIDLLERDVATTSASTSLDATSAVVAVVLHRGLDRHLPDSVRSLLDQTRRPDRLVVVHDGSGPPPEWICHQFPEVSLLSAAGPATAAALFQALVAAVDADAYLLQGEADWSSPDRLQALLTAAERTGAELVGSDSVVVTPTVPDVRMRHMPADGNAAFRSGHGGPVVDPSTMLVARRLIERLGGFSTTQPVAAADEFVARALTSARVVNVAAPLYMRRPSAQRDWSGPPDERSLIGRVVQAALGERARHHALALARRELPDVRLTDTRPAVDLVAVGGPALASRVERLHAPGRRHDGATVDLVPGPRSDAAPPVITVSGFDSLARFLACCLGQHPRLSPVSVTDWMVEMARSAARYLAEQRRGATGTAPDVVTAGGLYRAASTAVDAMFLADAAGGVPLGADHAPGRRWVGAVAAEPAALASVASLYPDARFVHVTRPVDDAVAAQLRSDDDVDAGDLYESWLAATRSILEIRRLLEPDQFLVVQFDDLVQHPETTIARCLEFAGEPNDERCAALALSAAEATGGGPVPDLDGVPAQADARLLSLALTHRPPAGRVERRLAHLSKVLSDGHRPEGGASTEPPPVPDGHQRNPYAPAHDLVRRHTHRDAPVCVVSKGDEMAVRFRGRMLGWHFPQTADGTYAGYHPADGREAIAHLEHLRDRGARYLLIPEPSAWWLDHYVEFRHHLERTYRRLPSGDGEGMLFDLRAGSPRGDGAGG